MQSLTRKPKQLSLTLAVAALAIIAVASALLLSGGGSPAQATAASLTPDINEGRSAPQLPNPDPTPRHATPEPCPEEEDNNNTLETVVSSGHIALFDVYWNPEEMELTNNPCPPMVEHVREEVTNNFGQGTGVFVDKYTRSPSSIDIDQTIIHVSNSAKVDLSASDTPYPSGMYRDLWEADNAENPDGGDRMVWVLPACPPEGPDDSELCVSASAALLNPEDWTDGGQRTGRVPIRPRPPD